MQRETPQLKSIEQVSEGWINKYVLTYVLPDGTDYQYESVSRKGLDAYRAELERLGKRSDAAIAAVDAGAEDFGASVLEEAEGVANLAEKRVADAVSIVPVTRRNELVLIREFRYPLNSWVIGLPAGLVEPGESYADAVDRELREETGYRLRSDIPKPAAIDPLPQSGRSSTGMSDESVLTVFAQVEKDEEQHTERGELIEVFTLPPLNDRAATALGAMRAKGSLVPTPFRSLFQAAVVSSIPKRNVAGLLERRPATRFFLAVLVYLPLRRSSSTLSAAL